MQADPVRVFVHLARGFSAEEWNRKYRDGSLIGINEPYAYGFYRAANHGCVVSYSSDTPESVFGKLLRLGFRWLLEFDPVHAWRNRHAILAADVVWTFTESQSLAVLFLLELLRPAQRPKLIAQTTYLFDRWRRLSVFHRHLFHRLLRKADILAMLSPADVQLAHEILPGVRAELIRFGVTTDVMIPPRADVMRRPIRLLSAGNDARRDWTTLLQAVKDWDDVELCIVSTAINPRLLEGLPNVRLAKINSNADYLALFDWANFVVISTVPNIHTSGLTVIQEAAVRGVPVICNDSVGLRAYFDDSEVKFVVAQDPKRLRAAIWDMASDPQASFEQAKRAQAKMGPHALSSEAYVRNYARLSKDLAAGRASAPIASVNAA